MALTFENEIKSKQVIDLAEKILIAVRTAPKARGYDNIVTAIATGDEIKAIASKMIELAESGKVQDFFQRDAANLLNSQAVVLIGVKIKSTNLLYCGLCGFQNCAEKDKYPNHPCTFNNIDLGIAIGSAVSIAMDNRIDNRVMYSIGMAVKDMGLLGDNVNIVMAVPLSASSKSPYFDRTQTK